MANGEQLMVSDLLRMDHINSFPQPFVAVFYGGDSWPLEDIDVQSGLLRIDVCGKLQVKHVGEVKHFVDATGETHAPDTWYR